MHSAFCALEIMGCGQPGSGPARRVPGEAAPSYSLSGSDGPLSLPGQRPSLLTSVTIIHPFSFRVLVTDGFVRTVTEVRVNNPVGSFKRFLETFSVVWSLLLVCFFRMLWSNGKLKATASRLKAHCSVEKSRQKQHFYNKSDFTVYLS